MNDGYAVILIEPRRPHEPELGVSGQINEVFVFANEADAIAWCDEHWPSERLAELGRQLALMPVSSRSLT